MPDDSSDYTPMNDAEFGESLRAHAEGMAQRSVTLLAGHLNTANLPVFLETCLRVPTEVQFDNALLSDHQFAEPQFLNRDGRRICALYVRPRYKSVPETLPVIVAYMAAAINYGASASPDLCECYGSILMDMSQDDFYAEVCRIADLEP